MKKLLTLLIALLASSSIFAQDDNNTRTDFRLKLLFGGKVGFNYANVYDTKGEEFQADAKFGLATGVFLSIPLGKYLGIQPEIMFSQKGFKATGRYIGSTYELKRTSNFIDLPVFFSLKPSEFITINAGPQYSYLIKQTDNFTNGTTSIDQEKGFQVDEDNYRKNILGAAVGVDINMKHLVLSARAAYDLQTNNANGSSSTPRYKNALYQFTIGYRLYTE
jgi:hypothetical protein